MIATSSIEQVRESVAAWKAGGLAVGLVPTMGYLHEGHESLILTAGRENDKVVVSIFVNPAQFGPGEDLAAYPRDLARDLARCEALGVAMVFAPEPESMYPPGLQTSVNVAGLTDGLCGKSRPGHFQGVCTVVCKLFALVEPDRAYFGQKDAQQLAVIRRMTRDLNLRVGIVGCPIVREANGLARSSRNAYLTHEGREAALALSRAVRLAESLAASGERDSARIIAAMRELFKAEPLVRVDYIEIVNPETMRPVDRLEPETLVALAAFVGKGRLLDNTLLRI